MEGHLKFGSLLSSPHSLFLIFFWRECGTKLSFGFVSCAFPCDQNRQLPLRRSAAKTRDLREESERERERARNREKANSARTRTYTYTLRLRAMEDKFMEVSYIYARHLQSFWGASGDFWQSQWDKFIDSFGK